jgi:hypothetical protein
MSEAKSGSTLPLAEIPQGLINIARPVGWQNAAPDVDVKRRIGPLAHPTHQLVLDRVGADEATRKKIALVGNESDPGLSKSNWQFSQR